MSAGAPRANHEHGTGKVAMSAPERSKVAIPEYASDIDVMLPD